MKKRVLLIGLLLLLSAACSNGTPDPPPQPTLDPQTPAGRGQVLFRAYCAPCHTITGETVLVGPSLDGIGSRAASRVEGLDAEGYLSQSILYPDNFVVEGYVEGTMQQNFASLLTSEEVNDLVAYLLALE